MEAPLAGVSLVKVKFCAPTYILNNRVLRRGARGGGSAFHPTTSDDNVQRPYPTFLYFARDEMPRDRKNVWAFFFFAEMSTQIHLIENLP